MLTWHDAAAGKGVCSLSQGVFYSWPCSEVPPSFLWGLEVPKRRCCRPEVVSLQWVQAAELCVVRSV